jgi:ABC-type multidrug transport system permease subunit
MRGPFLELALLCVFGSLAFSALGLLIGSRVRTVEAASGITNLVTLPMWILSGVFFSASRFPAFAQPFIKVLPLSALNDALRATMSQGARLPQLVPELTALGACLAVCFLLALKLFRWR